MVGTLLSEITEHLSISDMSTNESRRSDNGEVSEEAGLSGILFVVITYTAGVKKPADFLAVVKLTPNKHTKTTSPWLHRGQDQQSHFTVYWCRPTP